MQANIPLTIHHYNALLEVYIENDMSFKPDDILVTLNRKQLQPNGWEHNIDPKVCIWQYCICFSRRTYVILMRQYFQMNNVDGALGMLNTMKKNGIAASARVYDTLVMGYAQLG